MASAVKVIGFSALVAFGIVGIAKLTKKGLDLNTMLDTFDFGLRIKKFKFGKTVDITLDVDVINPSSFETPNFRKPYVEVLFTKPGEKAEVIASSKPSEDLCKIGKVGKYTIEDIQISFTLSNFISTAITVLKTLFSGCDWSDKSAAGLLHNAGIINSNIGKIYPYFSVKVLTDVEGIPLSKTFELA